MTTLSNKNVLITGATDGLGKLLSIELAKQNANVIIHGKNPDKIKATLAELKDLTSANYASICCDFNDTESIAEIFSQIKDLDILVNNAGVWSEGDTANDPVETILELTKVNLTAPMIITRTLIPTLLKSDFGQILNVVSIAGVQIPDDHIHSVYSATKYGLTGFTESLVKEFSHKNLRAMAIYPGRMNTTLFENAGVEIDEKHSEMFDPQETVEAMIFMLTRNKEVNLKRIDIINHR